MSGMSSYNVLTRTVTAYIKRELETNTNEKNYNKNHLAAHHKNVEILMNVFHLSRNSIILRVTMVIYLLQC